MPTRSRVRLAVLIGLGLGAAGLTVTAVQKVRTAAARTTAICRLKQLSLGQQNFHDTFLRLPGNGSGGLGLVDPKDAASAPWHYQILPYIEQNELFRAPGSATEESPAKVMAFLCPVRQRVGHVGGRPVADYAVNLLALYGPDSPPTPENTTATLNLGAMKDGSSCTIAAGAKSLHPDDYATADPAVDDTVLHRSAGGASRVGARYTVGATTVLKDLSALPPADFLFPAAVRDPDTRPGIAADTFGGPSRGSLVLAYFDGSVRSTTYDWLAADNTIPLDPALAWGTPPTAGTVDRVSQFRAALTPSGGEQVVFE